MRRTAGRSALPTLDRWECCGEALLAALVEPRRGAHQDSEGPLWAEYYCSVAM